MMKFTAILTSLVLLAAPAFADPVEGLWKTKPDDNGNFGHVRIAPCADRFCGVLVEAFDSSGAVKASDNIGKQIIWDMIAEGDGYYDGGKIWSPDRDKTYKSNMQLTGDSLAVKGCVLGICRDGGTWVRVN